jgi:DUF1365 family protein
MFARPLLFFGRVMHHRLRPVSHAFVYPAFYVQLPLRRLATANCGVFSVNRRNLLSVRNRDHGPRDGSPLLPWIEDVLREHGLPHDGEIVLQTFPRVFGYVFNPISFWYCYDRSGALVAILAEVRNTFGGYHNYLLHQDGAPVCDGDTLRADKVFHVSPFNKINGHYRFQFQLHSAEQQAAIDYDDGEGVLLQTALYGKPQAWTVSNLFGAVLWMPLLTIGVVFRIHWQAFKLWRKGVTFYGAKPPR